MEVSYDAIVTIDNRELLRIIPELLDGGESAVRVPLRL
jgi:hypothetical protein